MKRIAKTRMRMMMRAMSLLTEMLVCSSLACRSTCMLYSVHPRNLMQTSVSRKSRLSCIRIVLKL